MKNKCANCGRKIKRQERVCPKCKAKARADLKTVGLWVLAAVVTGVIYLLARRDAVAWRGNAAYGGEVLIPLLPLILWAGWRTVRDWVREIREMQREESE